VDSRSLRCLATTARVWSASRWVSRADVCAFFCRSLKKHRLGRMNQNAGQNVQRGSSRSITTGKNAGKGGMHAHISRTYSSPTRMHENHGYPEIRTSINPFQGGTPTKGETNTESWGGRERTRWPRAHNVGRGGGGPLRDPYKHDPTNRDRRKNRTHLTGLHCNLRKREHNPRVKAQEDHRPER